MNNEKEFHDNYMNRNGLFMGILIPGILFSGVIFAYVFAFLILTGNLGDGVTVEDPQEAVLILITTATLLLIFILGLFALKNKQIIKRNYLFNENQIRTIYKGKLETEIPFSEVSQIFKYKEGKLQAYGMTTCLAYRKNEEDPWIPVVRILKEKKGKENGRWLTVHIEQRFLETHLEKSEQLIDSGGCIDFPLISFNSENDRIKFENNMMHLATNPISNMKYNQRIEKHIRDYSDSIRLFQDRIEIKVGSNDVSDQVVRLESTDILTIIPINVGWTITGKGKGLLEREVANTILIKDHLDVIKMQLDTTNIVNSVLLEKLLKRKFN